MFVVVDSAAACQPGRSNRLRTQLEERKGQIYELEDSDCRFNLSTQEMDQI
jgi:hypothetical protein